MIEIDCTGKLNRRILIASIDDNFFVRMIGRFTGKFTLQSGFSYLAVPWQKPLVLGEACRVKARIAHLRRELGGDTSIN